MSTKNAQTKAKKLVNSAMANMAGSYLGPTVQDLLFSTPSQDVLHRVFKKFFSNKIILITGGSMGIGKELALTLAKYNTKLVICARTKDALKAVASDCERLGSEALVVPCDVTVASQCKRVVDACLSRFGGLDVLLLNAGISGSILFENMKELSLFEKMWRVNFMGYVHFVHAALPHLKRSKEGRIGAVSSMSGKLGVPFRSAYCSSKWAVNGFFEVLRAELAATNHSQLKISIASPGWVNTDIRSRHVVEQQSSYDSKKMLTVRECVDGFLYAIVTGKREERFEMKYRVMPILKAVSPKYVDQMIEKAVAEQLKAKM